MPTTLPPELWQSVAAYAPAADQRALLATARVLRAVARRLLFGTVVLRFGLWEHMRPDDAKSDRDDDDGDDDDDDARDLGERACATAERTHALMAHIACTPAFAGVVRNLHVLSYAFSQDFSADDLRMRELLAVIRALPHLGTFHWMGNFPHLSLTIALALSESCLDLHELRIPATHSARSVPGSLTMRSLCSLIVVCQLDIDNVHGYVPAHIAQCRPQLLQLINTNPRLTRLTIYSDLLNGLVPSVFEGLRELEIWGPRNEHLRELDRLLPRASALEGLALVEITQCQDVMPLLARHARAFARLTRLKLMSIDPVHSLDTMAALIAFVSAQAQLRWLDIDLPGLGRAQLFDLLAGLARVQSLEVLGFDCRATIELEDLQEIADVLPRALVALHLQLGFENVPFSDSAMRGLVACLRAMPALTLLHLQTMYATHRDGADELADALPALRTVGFGPALWDVEHADGLATLRRWTFREVALRSAETLGVAGEWLLRFHNLLGDADV